MPVVVIRVNSKFVVVAEETTRAVWFAEFALPASDAVSIMPATHPRLLAACQCHWLVREAYAARIAAFRANVSLALAIAVANTLLYGADHLSKGNVVRLPDDTSSDEDSNEDALAL
jgi:hypothetical protein